MDERRLNPDEHWRWLVENVSVVMRAAGDDPSTPVPDCPGWQVDTVVDHLARAMTAFRLFLTASADENPMPRILAALPDHATGEAAAELARRAMGELGDAVATLGHGHPCPFVLGNGNVATWLWHGACETWVHRADVEHATGQVVHLAPDRGVDALHWTAAFRRAIAGRAPAGPPSPIRCAATDADETVALGEGEPVATLRGAAGDLTLRLWNRQHGAVDGDGPAVSAWAALAIRSPLD